MADQDITIGIKTTGDTSGAEKVGTALKGLNEGPLKTMAARVDTAKASTVNLGMAANAFSYQMQDFTVQVGSGTNAITAFAQQAPQLIGGMQMAGLFTGGLGLAMSGLAVAIPLVLFGGRALINMFSETGDGAEDASKKADDAKKKFQDAGKAYGEFWEKGKKARADAIKEEEKALKQELRGIENRGQVNQDNIALTATLETAQSQISMIRDRIELTRIESAMTVATGEDLLRLTTEREAKTKAIFDWEQKIADIARQKEIDQATDKLNTAQDTFDSKKGGDATAYEAWAKLNKDVGNDRAEAARYKALMQQEIDLDQSIILEKTKELESIRQQSETAAARGQIGLSAGLDDKASGLEGLIVRLQNDIALYQRDLDEPNAAADRANIKQPELEALAAKSETSSTALKDAARDLAKAASDLNRLRLTQDAQKGVATAQVTEKEMGTIGTKITQNAKAALADIKSSMAAKGDKGNPDGFPGNDSPEAAAAKQIQGLLTDTKDDASQGGDLQKILSELKDALGKKDSVLAENLEKLIGYNKTCIEGYNTQKTRIDNMQSQIDQMR